ncbi:MAG: SDR family NAD(P)-dependent oxidoreductase [Gammaproteobacteria bacterium]|nr:SDR family NAD(P)-dependent oxidoreductase [Gammaproteobacteria bacterium]
MTNQTKTAVITGAGSGVGKAVAHIFLANGYNVVLSGRTESSLAAALEATSPTPDNGNGNGNGNDIGNGIIVPTDVGVAKDVDRLFDITIEKFGRVDVLFNNAGIGSPPVDIDELTVEQWERVMNTNIHGAFLCARRAFGEMKKQQPHGGRIINNGSISAHVPRPNSTPYTMSKHAMTGLTRCLALDGRPYDIACGQIDIGNAHTDMAEPLSVGARQPNGDVVGEPLMDVEHVATSVLHMAELPLSANVLFMNVMATKMPFVGRG